MKIVATVCDAAGAVNVGSSVECRSAIIELPDETLPPLIQKYLKNREWAAEGKNRYTYENLTFSILEEVTP